MSAFKKLLAFVLVLTPFVGQAGLVPVACENPQNCGTCEFVSMLNSVMQFIVAEAMPLIAVSLFIYAGFLLVTSRGDATQMQTAKSIFTNVALGILISLGAFLIVNTVVVGLVGENSEIVGWNSIECVYPAVATDVTFEFYTPPTGLTVGGSGTGRGGGSCVAAESGPCSADALRERGWGDLAEDAAVIVAAESGCDYAAESSSDRTVGGGSYSIGTWQINLAAHEIHCNTNNGTRIDLNCPSAFTAAGRGENNVRQYRVIDQTLATECRNAAAQYPECNEQIAIQLATASGDMGDWACSAARCGIQTSRNHLCPLNF